MTTWNYRIVRHDDCVGLHEVFYNEDGSVRAWTENPVRFVGDDEADLVRSLERALKDAVARPIIDPKDYER